MHLDLTSSDLAEGTIWPTMFFSPRAILALPLAALGCSLMLCLPAAGIVGDAPPAYSGVARYAVMISMDRSFCSGIVLAQDLVLTAAHCVANTSKAGVKIPGFAPANATEIVSHPQFNAEKLSDADLALLKFSNPLPNHFAPVFLAARPALVGDRLTVVGYGMAVEGDRKSFGTVRMATLTVSRIFNRLIVLTDVTGFHKSSCGGDSGGPVFATRSGVPLLIGVVIGTTAGLKSSTSKGCGDITDVIPVSSYRDWIAETAYKLGSPL